MAEIESKPTSEPADSTDKSPAEPTDKSKDLAEGRMAFSGHLRELRDRLRNSVIALAIGFGVCMNFREELYVLLAQPLVTAWSKLTPENAALGDMSFYFGDLIGPFWTYFSLAFWGGIFVASPVIFYQVWKFIAPGLYKNERRWGVAFSIASAFLFVGGAAFCYVMVLPAVCEFLLGYSTESLSAGHTQISVKPLPDMREYLDFAKKLLIGFGLIFELPLIILVMSFAGIVTHRSLWKFNRWALLLSFVVSAALTPPDIYSQMFMAGPLIILYNLSIILAFFVTIGKERKQRALERDD